MILITGALANGKREFAARQFFDITEGISWSDGERATWEEYMKAQCCFHFPFFVKRLMKEEPSVKAPDGWEDVLVLELLKLRGRILITDEIGCGIVPADPFDRAYREMVGRYCCSLADGAEQVWRICCGLGQRIK